MSFGRPHGAATQSAGVQVPHAAFGHPHPPCRPGMSMQSQHQGAHRAPVVNKFLQPIKTCGMFINDLIEDIQSDPWPVPQGHRHLRATGAALSAAVTLLEVREWSVDPMKNNLNISFLSAIINFPLSHLLSGYLLYC